MLGSTNLLIWSSDLTVKPKQSSECFGWHQDEAYADLGPPPKLCTAWLALTHASPTNGCVRFLRESHMAGQLPHSSLLLAAALSTITSSSASYVHPEVAPSDLVRAFGIRSSEPAGFEDSKHNGFPSSYLNALGQLSAEPKAEAEATAHSSKIYDEFSHQNILARRSAVDPGPEGSIGHGLFKQLMSYIFFAK